MDNKGIQTSQNVTMPDTRYLAYAMEGLKYAFKKVLKETFQEVLSEQGSMKLEEDKILSANELCKRWNISANTLRTYEHNLVIKPLPIGGKKKLYSMKDIHSAEESGFIKTIC